MARPLKTETGQTAQFNGSDPLSLAELGSAPSEPPVGVSLIYPDGNGRWQAFRNGGSPRRLAEVSLWTAFTPNFGNITIGNGTFHVAKHKRVDDIVFVLITFELGTTSSVDGLVTVVTPTTKVGNVNGNASMLDNGTARFLAGIQDDIILGQDNAAMNTTRPFTWTSTDRLYVDYYYQEA